MLMNWHSVIGYGLWYPMLKFVNNVRLIEHCFTSLVQTSPYKVLITTWPTYLHSLISVQPIAVPTPHLLSHFLNHKQSPHWNSQIANLHMHQSLVFGINLQIHFVSLISHDSLPRVSVKSSLTSSPLAASIRPTPTLSHSRFKTQNLLVSTKHSDRCSISHCTYQNTICSVRYTTETNLTPPNPCNPQPKNTVYCVSLYAHSTDNWH